MYQLQTCSSQLRCAAALCKMCGYWETGQSNLLRTDGTSILTLTQDTCIDVQHKKRGRPRLREESEFRVEPMIPTQTAQGPSPASYMQQTRPIAATRQRRAEYSRSLHSVTSDDSASYSSSTPGYGRQAPVQSPFSSQHAPTPMTARAGYEIATALLNLDLVIIRANRPFESIMLQGQDLKGRHISDVAAPADNESFIAIRNRLRGEREARDPAFMPPIQPAGQDPVQNIPEAEAEQYAEGFSDRTYTWTRAQRGISTETFPARVRLAKATTYFVVVTLPSFRPVEPAMAPMSGPVLAGPLLQPPGMLPPRQTASQSAPPGPYAPPPGPAQFAPPHGAFGYARTYPPPRLAPPQQQPPPTFAPGPPVAPRLPVAEPPTETTSFGPLAAAAREPPRIPGAPQLQLPPIVASPTAGTPRTQPAEAASQQQASSEEDEGDGRTRASKKRRMGIEDVLQR
jgi:hypothetical protein